MNWSTRRGQGSSAAPRRGAVLVLVLLALLLLASAVFFIFNVGAHLQKRTETQNAADATAAAGAGWVARTLNLVAMNNVEISKLLAQVQVLDAIPPALGDALLDHQAALDGIEAQLARGAYGEPGLTAGLREVADDLRRQVALLEELDAVLVTGPNNQGDYDIARMTFYELPTQDGGTVRGQLWDAMLALDTVSRTAMEELGPLAQVAAAKAAQVNQQGGDSQTHGFLVPFVPEVPWEDGEFADFADPMVNGNVPLDIDDEETNRGPFDVIFGWRQPQIRVTADEPWSDRFDIQTDYPLIQFRQNRRIPTEGEVVAYKNYGPFLFYRNQLDPAEAEAFGGSSVEGRGSVRSWFAERAALGANWRLNQFLARLGLGRSGFDDDSGRRRYGPVWDNNYDTRLEMIASGIRPFELFIYLEFAPVPLGSSQTPVLTDWGFFPFDGPSNIYHDFPPGELVGDYIYKTQRTLVERDGDNNVTAAYTQNIYIVWCAVDRDPTAPAPRNPNNFNEDDPLPVPIRLVEDALDHDSASERSRFLRFFAAADQPARAPFWASLFDGSDDDESLRPRPRVTATAAARVFNDHSWDLWTQMWAAQLEPVGDLQAWVDEMRRTGIVTLDYDFIDEERMEQTFYYLEAVAPTLKVIDDLEARQ